jgi:hypothetical protein
MPSTSAQPRHLLSVWNPSYAIDAMDAHVSVLVDQARRHRRGEADVTEDHVYAWWGRIRSERREGALPHLDQVLALDAQIQRRVPTYLYLTDYRSLYVADLGEITGDDPRNHPDDRARVPDYYLDLACDAWFQIWDLRRIVANDTTGVIKALRPLRNTRYHDRPVSLYGGMVDLPLIVWRDPEVDWFEDRRALIDDRLWAEREAELRSETDRLRADLRDNLFGPALWRAMEPATQTFLASAEAVLRARREDAAFDFGTVAVEYAKAVETELNALLFPLLRRAWASRSGPERRVRVDGRELDLGGRVPHQSLGAIRGLLLREPAVAEGIRTVAPHELTYLTDEYKLPRHLEKIVGMRNPAAHTGGVSRAELLARREEILGIGQMGVLGEMVRVRMRVGAG